MHLLLAHAQEKAKKVNIKTIRRKATRKIQKVKAFCQMAVEVKTQADAWNDAGDDDYEDDYVIRHDKMKDHYWQFPIRQCLHLKMYNLYKFC
jgi:hypothetical protein